MNLKNILSQQLKEFGLNPDEWVIHQLRPSRGGQEQATITHKDFPELKLQGLYKKHRKKLKPIGAQWMSLVFTGL